jgi:HPt (histidine-containing phosphotransfer) domain-containing protein
MTANVMPSDREEYRRAGMEDCLAKPFSANDLRLCLKRHLPVVGYEDPRRATWEACNASVIHRDLGLKLTDGDEEWYQRLIMRFVADHADAHTKIAAALRKGDIKLAARLAHSLKGVANMIGAARLSAAAARVEQAVQDEEGQGSAEKQMDLLKGELSSVLFELQPTSQL